MYDYIVRDPFTLNGVARHRGDRISGGDARELELPINAHLVSWCSRVPARGAAIDSPIAGARRGK